MSVFYKVTLNGVFQGKDNRNTLWYRSAIDPLDGVFGLGGAPKLAELIDENIIDAYLQLKPSAYTLQSLDIYPISEAFSLLYQLPYRHPVDRPGLGASVSGYDSTALCINMRFNLEPVLVGLDNLTAPRRGYIAVGPLLSSWLDDKGQMVESLFSTPGNDFDVLCQCLSMDLTSLTPPVAFFPIRVSAKYGVGGVGGGIVDWGYADVGSCTFDRFSSYRRSRRVTG